MQVNGKIKGKVTVAADMPQEDILALAKAQEAIKSLLDGKEIVEQIVVPAAWSIWSSNRRWRPAAAGHRPVLPIVLAAGRHWPGGSGRATPGPRWAIGPPAGVTAPC